MLTLFILLGSAVALKITDPTSHALRSEEQVDINEEELKWATSEIETNCTVTVDTKTKTLYLDSSLGKFTLKDSKVTDADGNVMDSPPKALVCLGNANAPSDGPALFFTASGAKYLFSSSSQGSPINFFMNKHCWARNNNIQYYLWFGQPKDTGFKSRDPGAAPCNDGKPGTHYFIIAGMRQVLMEKPNSWIVSMDISDTFFTEKMSHRRDLLDKFLDNKYDFIGGATAGGTKVFINGGIVAYKKGKWATDFAAEWFRNRCGSMNQLGMWNSLFRIWKRDHFPSFSWSTSRMSTYMPSTNGAHDYARAHSKSLLVGADQKAAMDQWCSSGKLPIALRYPHVLIHANMGSGGVDGIAFRADMDRNKEPFMCHNTWDRHKFPSCNAQASMCAKPEQCTCE